MEQFTCMAFGLISLCSVIGFAMSAQFLFFAERLYAQCTRLFDVPNAQKNLTHITQYLHVVQCLQSASAQPHSLLPGHHERGSDNSQFWAISWLCWVETYKWIAGFLCMCTFLVRGNVTLWLRSLPTLPPVLFNLCCPADLVLSCIYPFYFYFWPSLGLRETLWVLCTYAVCTDSKEAPEGWWAVSWDRRPLNSSEILLQGILKWDWLMGELIVHLHLITCTNATWADNINFSYSAEVSQKSQYLYAIRTRYFNSDFWF